MIKLKNHRPVRLIDSKGRFDLKPGETVSFSTIPKDLKGLVRKGYLLEVKSKPKTLTPESNPLESIETQANDVVETKESSGSTGSRAANNSNKKNPQAEDK